MYGTLHYGVCWHISIVLWVPTFVAQYLGCPSILRGDSANNQGEVSGQVLQLYVPPTQAATFQLPHQPSATFSWVQNTTKGHESGRQEQASKTHSARDTQLSVFLSKSSKNNPQGRYYSPITDNSGNKRLPWG